MKIFFSDLDIVENIMSINENKCLVQNFMIKNNFNFVKND